MLILGIFFIAVGISLIPALINEEARGALVQGVSSIPVSAAAACVYMLTGVALVFIGGLLWGKARDPEVPEVCPECKEELGGRIKCPSCEINTLPPVFALDTASLIGAVLSLLLGGAVIASPFISLKTGLTGLLAAAALVFSFTSAAMGVSSIAAERRKAGIAVCACIISIAVFGVIVYIML